MPELHLYNSRIISNYLEYLKQSRPDVSIEKLLKRSGILIYEMEDEGHWLTQRQVDKFHDVLLDMTGDPTISREAGRFVVTSRAFTAIRQFAIGFISPIQAYNRLGKIASYLSRHMRFQVNKISRNKVEIIITTKEGIPDRPYQCENRKGSFEAVATIFTNEAPVLEHPVCMHQGGDHCRYIVSWNEPKYMKWQRIRNFTLLPAFIITAVCGLVFSLDTFHVLTVLLASAVMGVSYYAHFCERKETYSKMQMQGDAANRLLDQITIGYNNALLVQEIGQAVSSILDIDQMLKYVMETLQKRIDFDRGMIMLADPDKKKLIYVRGYGYGPELEATIPQFHLDSPQSRGPFVLSFKEQKPFLINTLEDMESDISPRSWDFIRLLGVTSFICVPIVYEGKSEGILAVDNYRTHRPHSQSEVSLLMGIAPQIAISLNNAKSLRQIMESEERFRALSENSPDIIYTTDNGGCITYINPAAEEILGYSRTEMIGQPFTAYARPEDRQIVAGFGDHVKQGHDVVRNFEAKLLTKGGTERIFYVSAAPNFNAVGKMVGIVGTLKDFTEQRTLEQQLTHASRMSALGRLTGGISHDFNNILQAMNSYHQLLTLRKTPADQDWKYLMNIKALSKRATDLVGQLLIFSRKVETKMAPTDVNEEIRNFRDLLVGTLPKSIHLKLDLADDLYAINGDAGQLGQVIMNLAVNARDAMPNGGDLRIVTANTVVSTTTYRNEVKIKAGRYIIIRISDAGTGIVKEDLEHIFEPFFTTKEAGKGTGIGLSVVYGIIKNHNGYIFCASELGRGTTFDIYLPAAGIPSRKVDMEGDDRPTPVLTMGKETILLVDDESALLETGQELLSLLGYRVLTAASGEDALVVLRREDEKISLVILDLMMPGMGGEKCLPEILKIAPSVKVIIASGYTAGVRMGDIINAGAADFINKPYHIEDLGNKIRQILDRVGQPL